MRKFRGGLYRLGKLLGNAQAIASGDPRKMAKRAARVYVGRKTAGALWRIFR